MGPPLLQLGWTALHNAAFNGKLDVSELLLDAGAELDAAIVPAEKGKVSIHGLNCT